MVTQGRYAALALRGYARPGRTDLAAVRSAQIAARRARIAAEASADRLADEPPRSPMTARVSYALTDTARRPSRASLILDAALTAPPAAPGGQQKAPAAADAPHAADRFADGVTAAAKAIAGSLPQPAPARPLPPLRVMQTALCNDLTVGGNGLAGPDTVLVSASDVCTDALDSAADILRRTWPVPEGPAAMQAAGEDGDRFSRIG